MKQNQNNNILNIHTTLHQLTYFNVNSNVVGVFHAINRRTN